MNWLSLLLALVKSPFIQRTLSDVVSHDLDAVNMELLQVRHTIRTQQYLEHLAQAKRDALLSWAEKEKAAP